MLRLSKWQLSKNIEQIILKHVRSPEHFIFFAALNHDLRKAIIGMKTDETKTLAIPQEEAYSDAKDELAEHFYAKSPLEITPQVGMECQLKGKQKHFWQMP